VVNSPAALADDSAVTTVKSRADAAALMPLCTDPAWNPRGAVVPPETGAMEKEGVRTTSAMAAAPLPESPYDRVLAAAPEMRTAVAVGHDLLRQPHLRNDGKAVVHEIRGPMRKRAQLLESAARRALNETLDDVCAETEAPDTAADDERSYFGDVAAERGELTAADHLIVLSDDQEAMHVRSDLVEAARQQVPIFKVLGDQRVYVGRIGGPGFANADVRFEQR
jgi:hypothetical protein